MNFQISPRSIRWAWVKALEIMVATGATLRISSHITPPVSVPFAAEVGRTQ